MNSGGLWDPEWGPRREPKPRRVRMTVKRALARIAAAGRPANDHRRGVAILAYHGTGAAPGRPWWLDFRGQMELIEQLGYRVVSLAEAVGLLARDGQFREPTLAITFDDGFANNLDVAFPELQRRGWPATVFVTTGWLGRRPFLAPTELRSLTALGIEVGNHTHNHPDLTRLPPAEIRRELIECSERVEQLTGRRPRHFCYPNGAYDRRVRDAVAAAGMEAACTGRVGFNRPGQDRYLLRRLTVERGDGPRELRARLAGGYNFLALRYGHGPRL